MSYKIRRDEPLEESIRRVACEQIEAAIVVSQAEQNGDGSPVHETRKCLKKARAALRLLTGEVGQTDFKREDRRLRNVGRSISNIRDAEVRLETVEQLRGAVDRSRGRRFQQTEDLLAFELDSFLAAFSGWEGEAAAKLRRVSDGIAQGRLRKFTRHEICQTVKESYREGRKALKCAQEKGTPKQFHELRKRAKELWYQLRLLRPLGPSAFCPLSDELKVIGEILGHAHDLCFVAERLQSIDSRARNGSDRLDAWLKAQGKDLLCMACQLSRRFYSAKPKKFSARIARHFDSCRRKHAARQAGVT